MILIYVTYPSQEDARSISKKLLENKLVACANIFPAHESLYWWEGEIENAQEIAVIYKSRDELFDQIKAQIETLHSYDVPCIVALPIENGTPAFLKWIETETEI